MLKLKKSLLIALTTVTIVGSSVVLNTVQAFGIDNSKVQEISNDRGEKAKVYTSTDALEAERSKIKTVLNATFIEDPQDDKLTAFLSTDGSFINSHLYREGKYYSGVMSWASSYQGSIKIVDKENDAKIVLSSPKNTITSSQVTNNTGYSVGGNVSMDGKKPGVGLNASYDFSESRSYDQLNFITIQKKDSLKEASWDVVFNSTNDGYTRDSSHGIYGNQMFMVSRIYNSGDKNLTPIEKLPALISGGFSPNFSTVLKAPKDKEKSIIEVSLSIGRDTYYLYWNTSQWIGDNKKFETKTVKQYFMLDWKKHTVTPLNKTEEKFKFGCL